MAVEPGDSRGIQTNLFLASREFGKGKTLRDVWKYPNALLHQTDHAYHRMRLLEQWEHDPTMIR